MDPHTILEEGWDEEVHADELASPTNFKMPLVINRKAADLRWCSSVLRADCSGGDLW